MQDICHQLLEESGVEEMKKFESNVQGMGSSDKR